MKKTLLVFAALTSAVAAQPVAYAQITGYVTPTELTITFTSLSLVTTDNKQKTLLSGTFPTTFRRSDTDFASVPLAGVTVPRGRYIGVSICYNTDRSVKLNGVKYQGTTGSPSGLADSTAIYSTGTNAVAASSISTSAPAGGATTMTGLVVGNGTNNCSQSYFNNAICVASGGSGCDPADTVVDASATPPNLNILLDMYHAVAIDANAMSAENHLAVYPYPTIGTPGAAVHLTANPSAGIYADITLLFDASKKLMYTSSASNGIGTSFCSGVAAVTATAAPAGSFLNSYGPTWVQSANMTASAVAGVTSGEVQFATGNCGTGSTCVSNGINQITNVLIGVNTLTNVSCVADSAATPPYLGFTYAAGSSGAGVSAAATSFKVVRIIDPANLLGTCGTATHVCSMPSGVAADGYP